MKARKLLKLSSRHRLVLSIGIGLCMLGGGLLVVRYLKTQTNVQLPTSSYTVTSDTDHPEESKPKNEASYTVPAHQPRKIQILSRNISGLVQRVGTTRAHAVAVPSNIYYAGWYVDSGIPGQSRLSVIDGHISGNYTEGIFAHLKDVKPEDIVEVQFGDYTTKRFRVTETKQLPEAETSNYLFAKQPGITHQLNLVTCAGSYSRSNNRFSDRLVVVSSQL